MNKADHFFGGIEGNTQIIDALKKSVDNKRLTHSYIFEGGEGYGKNLIAESFSKYIFCKTKKFGCRCHSCVQFEADCHSDYIVTGREKTKSIGVELIRNNVLKEVYKKPFEYDNKIFIINEAELMTVEAQNALLRSLEEPPRYAVFILLTQDCGALLDTIISRCVCFKINPLDYGDITEYLITKGHNKEKSQMSAIYSKGGIGRALKLLEDDEFFELRNITNELMFARVKNLGNTGNLDELFDKCKKIEELNRPADFILIASVWLRDVLSYKAAGSIRLMQSDLAVDKAADLSFKSLYKSCNALLSLKKSIMANTPFRFALEAFAVKIYKCMGDNK